MTTDLTTQTTIEQLVRTYQAACADIRRAFSLIYEAEQSLSSVYTLGETNGIYVRNERHYRIGFSDPTRTLAFLRRDCWRVIVTRLELRRMMSIARAKELDNQLDDRRDMELPEITIENVQAFVSQYMDDLPNMLQEAVVEVHDWLRPRGHGPAYAQTYKTNQKGHGEIHAKVILAYVVEDGYGNAPFRVNYRYSAELTAVENVFSALDGRGQIAKGSHGSRLEDAINTSTDGTGETDLFRFKAFKNRNLHLEFRRHDLLAKLNKIAAGKTLQTGEQA